MIPIQDVNVKVCLAGDISVGKTSLVRRYVMDIFDDNYIATLGTKISKKKRMTRGHSKTSVHREGSGAGSIVEASKKNSSTIFAESPNFSLDIITLGCVGPRCI